MQLRRFSGSLLLAMIVCFSCVAVDAQHSLQHAAEHRSMHNLQQDTRAFRTSFARFLETDPQRRTKAGQDARALVARFVRQTSSLSQPSSNEALSRTRMHALVQSAMQIDTVIETLNLDVETRQRWHSVREELRSMTHEAAAAEPSEDVHAEAAENATGSCLVSAGARRSRQMVEECLQVTPATHPPCNAHNPCAMIADEIKRSCLLIGKDAPAFCSKYP